jgi:hypothetical protein
MEPVIDVPDEQLTEDERRFLLDLEFVQCLGNPKYLNCSSSAHVIYSISSVLIGVSTIYLIFFFF